MNKNQVDTLIELYSKISKHSNYQVLPSSLSALLGDNSLKIKSRNENERLEYILKNISINNKSILDIGANTGFFTFELINSDVAKIVVYEGNKAHADFIQYASELLNVSHKLDVNSSFYDFTDIPKEEKIDITLLLNVLHHVGSDYANLSDSISEAKKLILESINHMSSVTKTLVLQVGFNLHGDIKKPLFSGGTKKEMIDFIAEGTSRYWEINSIGIAESVNNSITYCNLNESNIERNDKLGEFLNRPIFIMTSKMS